MPLEKVSLSLVHPLSPLPPPPYIRHVCDDESFQLANLKFAFIFNALVCLRICVNVFQIHYSRCYGSTTQLFPVLRFYNTTIPGVTALQHNYSRCYGSTTQLFPRCYGSTTQLFPVLRFYNSTPTRVNSSCERPCQLLQRYCCCARSSRTLRKNYHPGG